MNEPDPQTIWRYKPSFPFTYFVDARGVESRTNALGLHDQEWTPLRLGAARRVLAVGDSFTFGWGVPLQDAYWPQLEKLLSAGEGDTAVFGLGYWMSTFDQHLIHLKRHYDAVRPQVVIHAIYPIHLLTILSHQLRTRAGEIVAVDDPFTAVKEGRLVREASGHRFQPPVGFPYLYATLRRAWAEREFTQNYCRYVKLTQDLGQDAWVAPLRPEYDEVFAEAYDKLFRCVKQAHDFVTSRGGRYVLALIPSVHQVSANWNGEGVDDLVGTNHFAERLEPFCRDNHIELLDPLPVFLGRPDREALYLVTDKHFSKQGHRRFAEFLRDRLWPNESAASASDRRQGHDSGEPLARHLGRDVQRRQQPEDSSPGEEIPEAAVVARPGQPLRDMEQRPGDF